MKKKIFINRKEVRGPWGGENSFMGALCGYLKKKYKITTDIKSNFDIALINALTLITLEDIKKIHERGIPIIHRKTNFIASGSEKIRRKINGIITGDKIQIDFSRYIKHSIFQSNFSYEFFQSEGFNSNYDIINNGADEHIFNLYLRNFLFKKKRKFWSPHDKFKLLIVSWSSNQMKGFKEYDSIDKSYNLENEEIKFVGNLPASIKFKKIISLKPQPKKKLAKIYKNSHALLFLGKYETCSNTITEAINCGLPIIYEDSGSNSEVVKNCGIPYSGFLKKDLAFIKSNYSNLIENCKKRDLKISLVAPKYEKIIERYLVQ